MGFLAIAGLLACLGLPVIAIAETTLDTPQGIITVVRAAIEADHRIRDDSGIQIIVQGGDVILAGAVNTSDERTAAVEAAAAAPGVSHVTDRLRVAAAGQVSPDILLKSRIESALKQDPVFRAEDEITVEVLSGAEADLGGIVDSWKKHRTATRDAFRAGARKVVNHLRVRNDPAGSEREFVYTAGKGQPTG